MPSRKDAETAGEHYGSVFSVSGPVIVAENLLGCAMYELVLPAIRIPSPVDHGRCAWATIGWSEK